MKKIIILLVLSFNLLPAIRNNHLSLCSTTVHAAGFGSEDNDEDYGDGNDNEAPDYIEDPNNDIPEGWTFDPSDGHLFDENGDWQGTYTYEPSLGEWVLSSYPDNGGDDGDDGDDDDGDDGDNPCDMGLCDWPPSPEDPGGGGDPPPQKDCAGVEGGSAQDKPNCGCVGGTTGIPVNQCPCTAASKEAGVTASVNYATDVKSKASQFAPMPANAVNQQEQYFAAYNNGTTSSIITTGTGGGNVSSVVSSTMISLAHTHPAGGQMAPSAADFFAMVGFASSAPGFTTSYIFAQDGSKYAMVISDLTALNAFAVLYPNTVDPATGGFNTSIVPGLNWTLTGGGLALNNYTPQEAEDGALAAVIATAGVTLLKAQPGSDVFKKIGAAPAFKADGVTPDMDTLDPNNPIRKYTRTDCK